MLRLRTNYREGEDVYLYRLKLTGATARRRFLEYLHSVNALEAHPRWCNAITTNCTTSIRDQQLADERPPWDWRILLNGRSDELLFARGMISTAGLSFAELKRRSLINERARAAPDAQTFSARIRAAAPEF